MDGPGKDPASARRRRRRTRLLIGSAGASLFLVLLVAFNSTRGPRHQGRSVRDWIDELGGDEPDNAQEALLAIGEPAVPYLLDAVQMESSETSSVLLDKLSEIPFLNRLAEHVAEQRTRREAIPDAAAEVLVGLRRYSGRFVPALVRVYQDPKRSEAVAERASTVLVELGPDAGSCLPACLAHLRVPKASRKQMTVSILAAIGPPAREAVPLLIGLLDSGENPVFHLTVAEALWTIDRRTNDAVHTCLRTLRGHRPPYDGAAAKQALDLLDHIGPAAGEARPILREYFFQGRPGIRFAAERALRSIDAEALLAIYAEANRIGKERIDGILGSLGPGDIWSQGPGRSNFFRSLPAMAALGPEAGAAVPRLVEVLTHAPQGPPRNRDRIETGSTSSNAPPTPSSSPGAATSRLSRFNNPGAIRAAVNVTALTAQAAHALGQIGDGSEAVIAALSTQLQSSNVIVAQACCEALGRLGPQARTALPALQSLLPVSPGSLRLAAAMAILNISPDLGPALVPTFQELEIGVDLRVHRAARLARWRIDRKGPSPMEELLDASMTDFYVDKLRMLAWFGPEARSALPELIGIVTTNTLAPLRVRAAEAIRRIDPPTYRRLHLPGPLALPENLQD